MRKNKKSKNTSNLPRRKFIRNSGLMAAGLYFSPGNTIGYARPEKRGHGADSNRIKDRLALSESAKMNGFVGRQLDLSYQNRILAQDVDHLIEPFRHRNETRLWQSEFWGKWFTSAVLAYRYRPGPELKKTLQTAVQGLIATQTEDGYIGNYQSESHLQQWDIWGRKYCLLGLLDYHELTGDENALKAAGRLAGHLIKEIKEKDGLIVNKGNYRGMAASSVLEPMVRLYNNTKNDKYLQFAEEIVQQWETPAGPQLISKSNVNVRERFPLPENWYSPEQGQKAYEMMSCYEGLLELYRVTGKEEYKKAVENTWENIRNTEINIAGSGASEEMWFGGRDKQTMPVTHFQETCVTVTWIKLNQQLLRLTGEAKYADEIERSYYNALLGSLSKDGSDWAKYTPLNGRRLPGSGQCGMQLNCCNASGPRGQFTLPLTAVMASDRGVSVNFFVDGTYKLKTPSGKELAVIQKTNYPVSGSIALSMELPREEEMTMRIRIPEWSRITKVFINDKAVEDVNPGEYLEIARKWSSKDIVLVEMDMRGRAVISGDTRKFAAITRGPIVLARDSRLPGPPLVTVNRPVTDKDGYVELKSASTNNTDECWMQYSAMFVPESYAEYEAEPIAISFCDYASAGYGAGKPAFEVWLAQLFSRRTK